MDGCSALSVVAMEDRARILRGEVSVPDELDGVSLLIPSSLVRGKSGSGSVCGGSVPSGVGVIRQIGGSLSLSSSGDCPSRLSAMWAALGRSFWLLQGGQIVIPCLRDLAVCLLMALFACVDDLFSQ